MAEAYYRSTAPEVLAAWDELQEQFAAYHAHADAIEAEFPEYHVVEVVWGGSNRKLKGLRAKERGQGSPCPLWLQKRGDIDWTPALRTRAGKKLRDRLEAVQVRPKQIPGMPHSVLADHSLCWPGFVVWEGTAWILWGCTADAVERCPAFDPALWERVPASAYHLAKEAAESATHAGDEQ